MRFSYVNATFGVGACLSPYLWAMGFQVQVSE